MTDPLPLPPVQPVIAQSTKLPVHVGVLCVLIYAALMGAILFVPKAQGVTDAVVQQIITATVGLVMLFAGWLWGSSQSSQRKDDAITNLSKGT